MTRQRHYETPAMYGIRLAREEAEQKANRRNQPITRGEILDAIDQTIHDRGGNVGDHHEAVMDMLNALRTAFE